MKKSALLLILLLALLVGIMPACAGATEYIKNADPHTVDSWQTFWGQDVTDTQNAGVIWSDKSVFTSAADFAAATGYTPRNELDERSFLVTLSAMASNKSIVGNSTIPTDTMLILDMSSSMYVANQKKYHDTVMAMANAVNMAIDELQTLNEYNRVGVAIYYGGPALPNNTSTNDMYVTLLPLDRYQAGNNGKFITHVGEGESFSGIAVAANVKNQSGKTVSGSHSAATVAGTYTQLGINAALDQFLKADTTVPSDASLQAGRERMPIFVLMSDGEPTAASTNYQTPGVSEMGNNYTVNRNPAQTDFATQMTASLAKLKADAHYVQRTPLFYTLSLGNNISDDVMKGSAANSEHTSTIKGYWEKLIAGQSVTETIEHYTQNSHSESSKAKHDVTFRRLAGVTVDGQQLGAFPSNMEQLDYVDRNFVAEQASDLTDAFRAIVEEIKIQSRYVPTWVNEHGYDLSGHIEFYDSISKHMEVDAVKGILIKDTLYTGANFASTLTTRMGTVDNPTPLGDEFIRAVRARMNLALEPARQLVDDAFYARQLYYESDTDYGNYIGWFADEDKEYLGFWDGTEITASTAVPARAAYAVKSYGMLGKGDDTEMLYSYIDVCYALGAQGSQHEKGETVVVWGVPASLIPLVSYDVTLDDDAFDDNGLFEDKGATVKFISDDPIRLVYEVSLREAITPYTVQTIMAGENDADAFRVEDGEYTFFTNKYNAADLDVKHDHPIDHLNTTAYFEPNAENERYYFTEHTLIYAKNGSAYEPYIGDFGPDPDGEYYRRYVVFDWENPTASDTRDATVRFKYIRIANVSLEKAEKMDTGNTWYIPMGTIYRAMSDFRHGKQQNTTDTLRYAHYLDIDQDIDSQLYYVVAALGNNGTITLNAAADLTLTKTFEGDTDEVTDVYKNAITFTVTGDGFEKTIPYSEFSNGSYTLTGLKLGEYTVTESNTALEHYTVTTTYQVGNEQTNRVTLTDGEAPVMAITNTYEAEPGNLTVEKIFHKDSDLTGENFPNGIPVTIAAVDGSAEYTETLNEDNGWRHTFRDLAPGDYTVSESSPHDPNYYAMSAVFTGVNQGTDNEVTVLPGYTRVTQMSITNKYTQGQAYELVIPFEKQVSLGEGGVLLPVGETTFYFTLDLKLAQSRALRSTVPPGELEVEYRGEIKASDLPGYDFMVTVDGADTVNGSIVIRGNAHDLRRLTVTITESEFGRLSRWTYEFGPSYAWTVTAQEQADGSFVPVITDADGQTAPTVHFDNFYTEVPKLPPTGDSSNLVLWTMLMALSGAGFLLIIRRRARRQR